MTEMDDITLLRYIEDDLSPEDRAVAKELIAGSPLLQEKIRVLKSTAQILGHTFRGPAAHSPRKGPVVVEQVYPAALAASLSQRAIARASYSESGVLYSASRQPQMAYAPFRKNQTMPPISQQLRRNSFSLGKWRYGIAPAIILGLMIGGFGSAYIFQTPETTLTVADSTVQDKGQVQPPNIDATVNSLASPAVPEITADNEGSLKSPSEFETATEHEGTAVSLANTKFVQNEILQAFGEDFVADDAQFPANWKTRLFAANQPGKPDTFSIGNDLNLSWTHILQFKLGDGSTCRKVKVELIETSATRLVAGCILPAQSWDQANVRPFSE